MLQAVMPGLLLTVLCSTAAAAKAAVSSVVGGTMLLKVMLSCTLHS
jgi:hypothetical protein